jgi:PleD family two-component response regulator
VLTLYAPGDQPDMLLKRADDALILAKEKGVNQILVALPNQ